MRHPPACWVVGGRHCQLSSGEHATTRKQQEHKQKVTGDETTSYQRGKIPHTYASQFSPLLSQKQRRQTNFKSPQGLRIKRYLEKRIQYATLLEAAAPLLAVLVRPCAVSIVHDAPCNVMEISTLRRRPVRAFAPWTGNPGHYFPAASSCQQIDTALLLIQTSITVLPRSAVRLRPHWLCCSVADAPPLRPEPI